MSRNKSFKDPRGHSLRIYSDVFDSPSFRALSPHDVLAYLALLRELKGYNNGDLSLPLTRSKRTGIKHHMTLARSLRALCAVGLIDVTRRGGCTRGGKKQVTLYRLTDRECFDIPAKMLEAKKETHEWKRITSVEQALELIQAAEDSVKEGTLKKNNQGHRVTTTTSPRDMVKPKTTSPRDTVTKKPCHGVSLVESTSNPVSMRVTAEFSTGAEIAPPRTPRVSPLYIATHRGDLSRARGGDNYRRLTPGCRGLFTGLLVGGRSEHRPNNSALSTEPSKKIEVARQAQQRAIDRTSRKLTTPEPAEGFARVRDADPLPADW